MIMAADYYFGLLTCYSYVRALLQIFDCSGFTISELSAVK